MEKKNFFGIENTCKNKSNLNAKINRVFSISIEDAKEFLKQKMSYEEIANKIGCSRMVAYRRLKELNLIDNQKSTMKKLKWHEPINDLQNKFLLGCLLGDGNITSKGMFQCNHSNKQLEYIQYKKHLLFNLVAPDFDLNYNIIKNHQNDKTYYSYSMRTMQNEKLKEVYGEFYKNGIKIFPYDFLINSSLDEYSLAIWYMDDGSRKKNRIELYSQGFNYVDNLKIIEFLYKKFNICGVIQENKSETYNVNPNHRHHVRFNTIDSDKFFKLVSPHILPSFQYKLPERYQIIQQK